jgi:hypothetical protein
LADIKPIRSGIAQAKFDVDGAMTKAARLSKFFDARTIDFNVITDPTDNIIQAPRRRIVSRALSLAK